MTHYRYCCCCHCKTYSLELMLLNTLQLLHTCAAHILALYQSLLHCVQQTTITSSSSNTYQCHALHQLTLLAACATVHSLLILCTLRVSIQSSRQCSSGCFNINTITISSEHCARLLFEPLFAVFHAVKCQHTVNELHSNPRHVCLQHGSVSHCAHSCQLKIQQKTAQMGCFWIQFEEPEVVRTGHSFHYFKCVCSASASAVCFAQSAQRCLDIARICVCARSTM
jgi:hypothetical protein